jgi:hypothetical protein
MSSVQRVRLQDPQVWAAAERLESFTWILARRVQDYRQSQGRVDCTVAIMEATAAAAVIEGLLYEIALRLLVHGIHVDIEADIATRLAPFNAARTEFEDQFGEVACA